MGSATAVGPLSPSVGFQYRTLIPTNYTVDWYQGGTAPTACTFRVEGSSDGIHWDDMTGSQDCTGQSLLSIVNKPVVFARVYIITYTGTGPTVFTYTRGSASGGPQ